MDDKMEELAGEFARKIMIRMFRMESEEERDAYMLAIDDYSEFMNKTLEVAENHAKNEKQGLTVEDKIQRIWESRMMDLEKLDGDTFSFYINRQIFGDDE